jgi:hypothetical protein
MRDYAKATFVDATNVSHSVTITKTNQGIYFVDRKNGIQSLRRTVYGNYEVVLTMDEFDKTSIVTFKGELVAELPHGKNLDSTFMGWLKATGKIGLVNELYKIQERNEDLAPGQDYNKVVEFAHRQNRTVHNGFTL